MTKVVTISAFVVLATVGQFTGAWAQSGACSDAAWGHVLQGLRWTTELDAGAKRCFDSEYSNGENATNAVAHCNPAWDDLKGKAPKDSHSDDERRFVDCGPVICNWFKSNGWDRGC